MTVCEYADCKSDATVNWCDISLVCDSHAAEATAWLNLAKIYNLYAPDATTRKTPYTPKPLYKPTDNPCLYVVTHDDPPGVYKIGVAANLKHRLSGLGTGSPKRLRLEHVIYHRAPGLIEMHLHARFDAQRVRGEWFALSANDLNYIKTEAQDAINDYLATRSE